ncbi:MAG TPA: redoxin domain-containing protein [Planctomycetes bacterium]|nr:redoxin domain-containing protein [Fuerstiella sp.]HIK92692.1 redoxin domain-containing protein [Planctomycetota bacterium]
MMPNICALLCLLPMSAGAVVDESTGGPKSPVQEYKALVDEYEEVGGAKQFAGRFFELAKKHQKDPVAVQALVWILDKRRSQPAATRALELLGKHHLQSPALAQACRSIARVPAMAAEQLLRRTLEKSSHAPVKEQACYYLAYLLEQQASAVDQLTADDELTERVLQYYGQEYGKYFIGLNRAKLDGKLEKVYELMTTSFSDVQIDEQKLGDLADTALFRIRHLSPGRVAAEITGEDIYGKELKLSDYRGKVVMLYFWAHW